LSSPAKTVAAAGIATELGCHSFRPTGITVYLKHGGLLEPRSRWPRMKARLYDRRSDPDHPR